MMTSFPPGGAKAMAGDYIRVVDTQAELAILESRLPEAWPDKTTLRPYLEKLLANPGSMVFIAPETPRGPEGPIHLGKAGFPRRNAPPSVKLSSPSTPAAKRSALTI